jgi:hypothetical protein
MKLMKGRLIFAVALFVVFVFFLIATLSFRSMRDKVFPLMAIIPALILLVYQILKEVLSFRHEKGSMGEETKERSRRYFGVGIWMAITLIMFWLIGFLGTVLLFPFIYLRYHHEGWLLSIALPLGCGIFFYTIFSLALGLSLYQGFLFSNILG